MQYPEITQAAENGERKITTEMDCTTLFPYLQQQRPTVVLLFSSAAWHLLIINLGS